MKAPDAVDVERYSLDDLVYLMARLRDPDDGCPWDRQQTMRSVVPHTLEECYELADAIEHGDSRHIREELGDVLFQVVFYAHIAGEAGEFDLGDVIDGLVTKLIRRHPHVFPAGNLASRLPADAGAATTGEVRGRWEAIKTLEREEKSSGSSDGGSLMDDVPLALPALVRARKLQKRAARVTFDWYHPAQVLDKLSEELGELAEAMQQRSPEHIADEAGDVLFSVVNYLRHLDIDAEHALRRGNNKFERRFRAMEALARSRQQDLASLDAQDLDDLWNAVKAAEGSDRA